MKTPVPAIKIHVLIFLIAFLSITIYKAEANRYVWIGATNTHWSTATNWYDSTSLAVASSAPGSGDNVAIHDSITIKQGIFGGGAVTRNNPILDASAITVARLDIYGGGALYGASGDSLTVNGNVFIQDSGGVNASLFTRGSSILITGNVSGTGTLDASSGASMIYINGNFSSGFLRGNGNQSVIFQGSSGQSITGSFTFNNLVINNTTTLNNSAEIDNNLSGSSTLTANGSITINIAGNITVSSYSPSTSTMVLARNGINSGTGPQYINAQTYYKLEIFTDSVELTGAVTVSNTLTFDGSLNTADNRANIILNGFNFTIGSSATISGAPGSGYFVTNSTGGLKMDATTSGVSYPVGHTSARYNPLVLTTDVVSGTVNCIASVFEDRVTNSTGTAIGSDIVAETWLVVPQGSVSAMTVTTQWTAGGSGSVNEELSLNRSLLYLSYRTVNPSAWTPFGTTTGASSAGSDPYTFTDAATIAMTSSTTYYIATGDHASALPVTLTSFNAAYKSGIVNLNWTTASEINNSHFEIERSVNGQSWNIIGRVEGHGNSLVTNNYAAFDNLQGMIPASNIYYRLKQVDFNGVYTYSDIRTVNINDAQAALSTFPNPAANVLNVQWNSKSNDNAVLRIMNINGVTVYTETVSGSGDLKRQIDMSAYPAGTYYVQVIAADNTSSKTIYKN
jgi:hypothetical protein